MKVTQQTSTRLVFTHANELLLRVTLPLFASTYVLLQGATLLGLILFFGVAAIACYTCSIETYVFNKLEQQFTLIRSSPLRKSEVLTQPLREITNIGMQTELGCDVPQAFIILTSASSKSMRLPLQALAFTKEEQIILGCLLGTFLGVPVHYQKIQNPSQGWRKQNVDHPRIR